MKLALLGAVGALVISIAGASAQPVTPDTSCAAIAIVNPRFLANIMMMAIRQGGAAGVQPYAQWLNEYTNLGRSGDGGVDAAERLDRATASVGGYGPSEAERLDRANRARSEAASLMPTLLAACAANREQPLLRVMQGVLSRAGY